MDPIAELRSPLLGAVPGLRHGFVADARRAPGGLLRPRQVHGARVLPVEALAGDPQEADGALTRPGAPAVAVVTADCVPLLVADPAGRVAAAVHAGWRGLAAGIVERAVDAVRAVAGPGGLVAAVGPAAGPCCYETTEEIAERLDPGGRHRRRSRPGHALLDLAGVASDRLAARDIEVDRIGGCTICDTRWPSYRREGDRAGRLLAYVGFAARRSGEDAG